MLRGGGVQTKRKTPFERLFFQRLAIDLGEGQTIKMRLVDLSIDFEVPAVVYKNSYGEISSVGDEAKKEYRAGAPGELIRPIKNGRIEDYSAAQALLVHCIDLAAGRQKTIWPRPSVSLAISSEMGSVEQQVAKELIFSAGGSAKTRLIPQTVAAAFGMSLSMPKGSTTAIGGVGWGVSQWSVIEQDGWQLLYSAPYGWKDLVAMVAGHLESRPKHRIKCTIEEIERVLTDVASLSIQKKNATADLYGSSVLSGSPLSSSVGSEEILDVVEKWVEVIIENIEDAASRAPSELSKGLYQDARPFYVFGKILSVSGIEDYLFSRTGISFEAAVDPEGVVVDGLSLMARAPESFHSRLFIHSKLGRGAK